MAAVAVAGAVHEIAAERHLVGVLAGEVQLVRRNRRRRKTLLHLRLRNRIFRIVRKGWAARRRHECQRRSRYCCPAMNMRHAYLRVESHPGRCEKGYGN